ncbi:MAG TPA: outer membrane beta-barrel protein [Candidatus Omnitrophota bacterium]|nr:outer membrane beta-barrel protein [Candidatus Omnitrophota bacterium]HRZ14120.1 outer membrane beta-barrel protein [Candidatus Omnitrophota bacterium]
MRPRLSRFFIFRRSAVSSLIVTAVCSVVCCFCAPARAHAYLINGWDLKALGSLSVSYDDNITYAQTNEKDDYITTASVGLDAAYEGKTQNLAFTARINQQFFDKYSDFDNTSEHINARYNRELNPYERFSLSDTFTHAEEPSSFEDEFGRTSGRYSYLRNRFNASYSRDFTKEFTGSLRYANEITDYSRNDMSDSYYNRFGVSGDYIFSSKTQGSISYDIAVREFDPGASATINSLGAGGRHYFTSQVYLDGKTGYDFIRSFNNRNYVKPFFQVTLTDDLDATTRASISYSKQYTTNSSTQDLFNQWQFSAGLGNQIFRRLGLGVNAFYGEGTYTVVDVRDTFQGINVGLVYDVADNIKANVSYAYSQTDSNSDTRDYEKNAVTCGLTVLF